MAILDTDRNKQTDLNTLVGHQCHDNAICDIAWTPGQQKLISSSSDCQSRLWDVGPTDLTLIRTFKGHSRSVKVVTYRPEDGNVFATGGRDGAILIWDTRVSQNADLINRAENSIFRGHDHEAKALTPSTSSSSKRHSNPYQNGSNVPNACKSSITGLSFQDENTLISCGAGDGIIKVWDLRRNYSCYKKEPLPKYSLPYAGTSTFKGFTNITMDLDRYRLYVSCMDNTIYCYNVATYQAQPVQRYYGLKNGSYYIRTCLSADGKYLISGSSDDKAYIWNVERPLPIVTLDAHEVEVSCVAWGRTKDLRLVTSSDDASLKIWRVAPSELSTDEEQLYHGEAILNEANRLPASSSFAGSSGWSSKKAQSFATPTVRRTALKRTFAELADSAGHSGNSKKRARRLFSDTSGDYSDASPVKQLKFSPLSERLDLNDVIPCTPSTSNRIALTFNSPTSNMPNYVLNGEAPHLPIISPKRKLKENIDWLTKIRKQRLLHSPTLQHVLEEGGGGSPSYPGVAGNSSSSSSSGIRSVRQGSPRTVRGESPRTRCTERANSTSHTDGQLHPKTPSSSRKRRNSTTTPTSSDVSIRRFLKRTPVTPHEGPSTSK